jgi:hypothetical protein
MTLIEYIIGGVFIMLAGVLLNSLRMKINSKEPKSLCDEKHGHTVEELKKGDVKFAAIMKTQTDIVKSLGRVEGKLNGK